MIYFTNFSLNESFIRYELSDYTLGGLMNSAKGWNEEQEWL